jgi:hypothetical protein
VKNVVLILLFYVFVFPVTVSATPIVYSASGLVNYSIYQDGIYQGFEEVNLHGEVTIDDEFTVTYESDTRYWYHYSVLNFNLTTTYDNWAEGTSNTNELLLEIDENAGWFGDALLPTLISGNSSINFLDTDGTNLGRTVDVASVLAPKISLGYFDINSSDGITTPDFGNVLLTRTASVTEPASLALVGLGLIGFGLASRKVIK